ncbi:MAG: TIGR02301 family protein [Rhizobiaceae bacterium]
MFRRGVSSFFFTMLIACGLAWPVYAQEKAEAPPQPVPALVPDPPYEAKLVRLAEVLGSVHYLRRLCGEKSMEWRQSMEELVQAENPRPERKAKLIASFNHGYRAFDGVHVRCSESAGSALALYMAEGETLANDIASRYGN